MSGPASETPGGRVDRVPATGLFGAVLAGGASTRFGRDKARAEISGRSMAGRAFDALGPWVDARGVVVAADAPRGPAPGVPEAAIRRDSQPGLGPLEGLRVALEWARDEGCEGLVVLACDLPLVDAALVGALVRAWRERGTDAPDGVVPVVAGRAQPLAAVYATGVLESVTERLAQGVRSVTRVVDRLRIARVPTGSAGLPAGRFLNVNTTEDAGRARAALEARRGPAHHGPGERGPVEEEQVDTGG